MVSIGVRVSVAVDDDGSRGEAVLSATVGDVSGATVVVLEVESAGVAVPFSGDTVVVDSPGASERELQPANSIETITRTTSTEWLSTVSSPSFV